MEKLLKKLGIDASLSDEEILSALEKKQMEYLDRLDSVEDEERKKELKGDLEDMEGAISSLSWSLKRRNNGIAEDNASTGIAVDDASDEKQNQASNKENNNNQNNLAAYMTNSGKSGEPAKDKPKEKNHNLEMAYNYYYGRPPYHQSTEDALNSISWALDEGLDDKERGEAFAFLGYIYAQPYYESTRVGSKFVVENYNEALRYTEWAIELGNSYAYFVMGLLIINDCNCGLCEINQPGVNHVPTLENYKKRYFTMVENHDCIGERRDTWKNAEYVEKTLLPKLDKAKEYFDKSLELGEESARPYMWYWDFDLMLQNELYARAKDLAKEDGNRWYQIYRKTWWIDDIENAVKYGSKQAQEEIGGARGLREIEKDLDAKDYKKRQRKEGIKEFIGIFLKLLIPSFILSCFLGDPVFHVTSYGQWAAVVIGMDLAVCAVIRLYNKIRWGI